VHTKEKSARGSERRVMFMDVRALEAAPYKTAAPASCRLSRGHLARAGGGEPP
jgi:hypothetical protein